MAFLHGEHHSSNSQAGLEVVPQTLHLSSIGHLVIADESEDDGPMPPSEMFVPSVFTLTKLTIAKSCGTCQGISTQNQLQVCRMQNDGAAVEIFGVLSGLQSLFSPTLLDKI